MDVDVVLDGLAGVQLSCCGELDLGVVVMQQVHEHLLCIDGCANPA